jgi:hypothetical protein
LTPEQALTLLANATANLQGTRQDHAVIQRALAVLAEVVNTPRLEFVGGAGESAETG